jgi:ribosomal protein L32
LALFFELQIGLEYLIMLPILLICCLLPYFRKGGQKAQPGGPRENDVWFIPQKIEKTYKLIEKTTADWKETEIETEAPKQTLTSIFTGSGKKIPEGFQVTQSVAPTLYELFSQREGGVTFELTEAQGGGTVVKTSYQPTAKQRAQTMKAKLPIKALAALCPSCGKMTLPDFALCPYCGEKLK